MPEEQAFCVLVKLMYDYGLRDLYKDRFDNLHMRFYQLNRLIEVCNKFWLIRLIIIVILIIIDFLGPAARTL